MATAALPNGHGLVNASRTGASIGLVIGLIILVLFSAWVAHRIYPHVMASVYRQYPSTQHIYTNQPPPQKVEMENSGLELIPIVQYHAGLVSDARLRVGKPYITLHTTSEGAAATLNQISSEPTAPVRVEEKDVEAQIPAGRTPQTRLTIDNRALQSASQEPASCSVCTEDFLEGENVRILLCAHIYHRRCIDSWVLDFAGTCPLWWVKSME